MGRWGVELRDFNSHRGRNTSVKDERHLFHTQHVHPTCRLGLFFPMSLIISLPLRTVYKKMGWLLFEIDQSVIIFTSRPLGAGMINGTNQGSIK